MTSALHSMHRQLLLDIHPERSPDLTNFVAGDNVELVARLATLADPINFDQIYLWGPPGCGRSHLLHGTLQAARQKNRPAILVDNSQSDMELVLPPGCLVIVDDVDCLDEAAQATLFRIFNTARLVGLALLLAGNAPPLQLQSTLREDLRTRIGSTLIYEVHPLSDTEKAKALRHHCEQRAQRIDDALIDYLLRHGRRDLPSLIAVLDDADRISLEQHRPLTLPLLREILQASMDPSATPESALTDQPIPSTAP